VHEEEYELSVIRIALAADPRGDLIRPRNEQKVWPIYPPSAPRSAHKDTEDAGLRPAPQGTQIPQRMPTAHRADANPPRKHVRYF